ncbi:hypothetical protein ACMA5I_07175 [Paracoccaceae bacterium GXU_MW_L88]
MRKMILAVALALGGAAPAMAQELSVELNKVEPSEEACRLTFVTRNGLEADLDKLVIETVFFDEEGVVLGLKTLNLGNVSQDRPRVSAFPLSDIDCDAAASVLVNGVSACEGEGIDAAACGDALEITNKSDLETLQ